MTSIINNPESLDDCWHKPEVVEFAPTNTRVKALKAPLIARTRVKEDRSFQILIAHQDLKKPLRFRVVAGDVLQVEWTWRYISQTFKVGAPVTRAVVYAKDVVPTFCGRPESTELDYAVMKYITSQALRNIARQRNLVVCALKTRGNEGLAEVCEDIGICVEQVADYMFELSAKARICLGQLDHLKRAEKLNASSTDALSVLSNLRLSNLRVDSPEVVMALKTDPASTLYIDGVEA